MVSNLKLLLHDDVTYLLFCVINDRHFCMPHNRYPDALTQILPLLLTWAHASIRMLVSAFLVNLGLFYTAMGCLSVALTKSRFPLYVLGLLVYAGFLEIIYWPISDIALGYGALVPVAGFLLDPEGKRGPLRWWQAVIAMSCLLAAIFFHPSVVLGVLGLVALSILEARRFDWRHGLSLAMLPGYVIYKYWTLDSYEAGHLSTSAWNDNNHGNDLTILMTQVLPLYLPLLIFSLYALGRTMKSKGSALGITLVSYAGAILYVLCFYLPAHSYSYVGLIRCNLMIPATFFLALGGCYGLFRQMPGGRPWLPCFLAGTAAFLIATIQLSSHYREVNDLTMQIVAKARAEHVTLAYINTGPTFTNYRLGWSISLDTMLWSMLEGPGDKVSVVEEATLNSRFGPGYLKEHEHFCGGLFFRVAKFQDMNLDYFSFEPTAYRPISMPGP